MFNRPFHRAVVLIDGMFLQNIMNELGLFGKVDLLAFSDKLAGPDFVRARTYLFDALPPEGSPGRSHKQQFLDRIAYLPKFQVETGYVRLEKKTCPNCNAVVDFPRQKKVDILLATRLLECSLDLKIDKIVLVAGDLDFVPAVEIAKKKTEIVLAYAETERTGTAAQLKKSCDDRIILTREFFGDCALKDRVG